MSSSNSSLVFLKLIFLLLERTGDTAEAKMRQKLENPSAGFQLALINVNICSRCDELLLIRIKEK